MPSSECSTIGDTAFSASRQANPAVERTDSIQVARPPYPSDLTDAQWRRAAAVIATEGRRRTATDAREVLDAIRYRWATGCVWRMLPHDFPAWQTVYGHFLKWQREGKLIALRDLLSQRPSTDA